MKDAHYCAYILTVKDGKTLWGKPFPTHINLILGLASFDSLNRTASWQLSPF